MLSCPSDDTATSVREKPGGQWVKPRGMKAENT